MKKEKFWFAYELNKAKNTAKRVYRFNKGLMERKNKDGTWSEERAQLCIFCGEDMDYEEISEQEANNLSVLF